MRFVDLCVIQSVEGKLVHNSFFTISFIFTYTEIIHFQKITVNYYMFWISLIDYIYNDTVFYKFPFYILVNFFLKDMPDKPYRYIQLHMYGYLFVLFINHISFRNDKYCTEKQLILKENCRTPQVDCNDFLFKLMNNTYSRNL